MGRLERLFNDIYITMCFGCSINMTALVYDELGVIINNVFALVMSALLIVVPVLTSAMLLHRWKIEKKDDN